MIWRIRHEKECRESVRKMSWSILKFRFGIANRMIEQKYTPQDILNFLTSLEFLSKGRDVDRKA